MTDLPILLALLAVAWAAWRRPWVGVLGLVFVGLMHPQGYATGWLQGAPVYAAMGAAVAIASARQFAIERRLPRLWWDWRLGVAGLLGALMLLSTWLGINPWVGWPKLADIAKMLPVLALVLLLIDDREKLRWLLMTMALSISVVVLKGGFWAVFTGLNDRVYGPPGSQYGDNNEFAVAAAMAIPLLALWYGEVRDVGVRVALAVLIVFGFVAVLSTWSRGGLLCALTVALLLVLHSRRKWVALPLLVAGVALAGVGLPDDWFARMQTLQAPEAEGSAATRLELWRLGWDYALQHPWAGGGLGSWIYLSLPVGGSRAWHSAYVGIAVEHGLLGLTLWCALLFGTMAELSHRAWRLRGGAHAALASQAAMLCASLAAYAVGSAFLSIAYWELLYLLIAASMLTLRLAATSRPVPLAAEGLPPGPGVSVKFTTPPASAASSRSLGG